MKLLFAALMIVAGSLQGQDLTGIWRGYFYSGHGLYKQYYKYEVQINQKANASLEGVTYSYHTTIFYAKSALTGIWFKSSKNVLIQEKDLLDVKMSAGTEACPMTCNLSYSKIDTIEVLEGTFTSVKSDNSDCGAGNVYLERVQQSDFEKEDFLKKKPGIPSVPQKLKKLPDDATIVNIKKLQSALGITTDGIAGPQTIAKLQSRLPGIGDNPDFSNDDMVNGWLQQLKTSSTPTKPAPAPNNNATANVKKLQSALGVPADGVAGPQTLATLQSKLPDVTGKPDFTNDKAIQQLVNRLQQNKATAKMPAPQPQKTEPPAVDTVSKVPQIAEQTPKVPEKTVPVPQILKDRSNNLYKTIITKSPNIHIELYDNGEIDGDTITVYP